MRLLRGPQLQAQRARALFLTVIGQSNGVASGVAATAPPAGTGTPANCWIWAPGSTSFVPYQAGVNSDPAGGSGGWGSELAFVRSLRDAGDNRPIYIHKFAVPGSALAVGWQTSGGTQFNNWSGQRPTMRAAIPGGASTVDEVVLWCQGEADSQPSRDTAYSANLNALIAAHRAMDSNGAGALWIIERIRPYTGDGVTFPLPSAYRVRQAQEEARANVRVIDLDFDQSNFGLIHPGSSWVVGKGERCYAAWAFGTVVSDTSPSNLASITDVTGASTGATVTSNEIAIAGIDRGSVVTITDGEYRVRCSDDTVFQDWTSAPGTIHPFQKLTLRATASGSSSTAVTVTVTVGGVSEAWSVTTASSSLSISGTPSPTAAVGQAYSFVATVTNGTAPYTFSFAAGTPPAGLAPTSTGFGGTPTTAGTASGLVLRVTDSLGATADLGPFDITVEAAALAVWDSSLPSGSPAQLAYSNSDRTVSTTAATAGARFTRSPASLGQTAGKWYFRVSITGSTSGGRGFGLGTTTSGTGNAVTGGTISTHRWWWSGTAAVTNSGTTGMGLNISTTDGEYELAVDVDANLVWFRRVAGGNWNNNASANPATGVGGLSISARGSNAVHPLAALPNSSALGSITIVSGTPPSGFTEWD